MGGAEEKGDEETHRNTGRTDTRRVVGNIRRVHAVREQKRRRRRRSRAKTRRQRL